ncbi:hypothetical protein FQR65_LT01937 [Abscondita terminalis]|nr:hypothetical protein FQR65_LT01937 [Abscondita terminalis]
MIPLEYILCLAGSFSTLQSGLSIGWTSYALPQMLRNDSTIALTNDEGSWVASMFVVGNVVGPLLAALTIDAFGRKTMLLVTSLPLCVSWLIIAYARTTWNLYLARFIAGLSDGVLFSCLPLYLAEICNSKVRGFLISGTVAVLFCGTFLANLLGAFLSMVHVAFTCAVLSLVPLILYLFIPESPQFYIIRKKMDQAKVSLEKFNRGKNADVLVSLIKNSLDEQRMNQEKWWQPFMDKSNCKALALMLALGFFHQFTGIMGITFYIETLFENAKKDINPIVFISVYYVLQIAVAALNSILIDRVGRRPLLLISMSLVIVGLSFVTTHFKLESFTPNNSNSFSWLAIVGLFVFIVGCTTGLVNVSLVLASELFPLNFKACATGIINVVFGITGTAMPKFFQYTKDEFGCFSSLQCGLNLGWSSYALPQLLRNDSRTPLTNDEGSWVASIFLFGTIFGSLLIGCTIDIFGRKTVLLVTSLPFLGTWLTIAYAKTAWNLYLARFLGGILDGMIQSCMPLYLAEVCDAKIRGFLVSGTVVAIFFGTFLANLLGAFLNTFEVALTSAFLSLIPFILYIMIPDSPQFYIIKKNIDQAKISLEKFHGVDNVDGLLSSLQNNLIEQQTNKELWWKPFVDKNNCKALALMIALEFFHHFSGIFGITFYMEMVFASTKGNVNPIVFISIFYLLQIVTSTINAIFIDKVGRRSLLITSMLLVTFGLLCISIYFVIEVIEQNTISNYSYLVILGLFIYIIGYSVGLGNIPVVLCSEIFPLYFKARATAISNILFGLIGTGSPKFFQYTKDTYGTYVPFSAFTICTACGLIFACLCVPETKRDTLEEIQTKLRSKQSSSSTIEQL